MDANVFGDRQWLARGARRLKTGRWRQQNKPIQ